MSATGSQTSPVGTRRILLVEDETALLRLMSEFLTHAGFEVEACLTGAQALDRLGELSGQLELAVIDLSLPDMPGDEVARRILQVSPELPVLICSGLPFSVEGMPGRVRFLQKPFLPKMLLREIEAITIP